MALTRAGWTNPTGVQRPGLQRVAYYFQDGTLRREYWMVLDPTQNSQTVKRDLMTHLKSVSLRFMDVQSGNVKQLDPRRIPAPPRAGITWSPIWPPMNNAGQNNLRYRPLAVEITLRPRTGARSSATSRSPDDRPHSPTAARDATVARTAAWNCAVGRDFARGSWHYHRGGHCLSQRHVGASRDRDTVVR